MDGILDSKYAEERQKKKYLEFRYKERALVAAWMVRLFLPSYKQIANFQILDLGAAEGLALLEMSRKLKHGFYLGLEYDQSLIDIAPKMPANVVLRKGDANRLIDIEDNSIDVVSALAILEHLGNIELAIKEIKRVLKPGGILIATSPIDFWDKLSDKLGPKNHFGGDHHVFEVNKKSFTNLMAKEKLDFIYFHKFMWAPVGFLPYLKVSISPSLAWFLDRFFWKIKIFNFLFVNQCFVARKNID